jgi:tetratricopeptide (TPR) repeat protein
MLMSGAEITQPARAEENGKKFFRAGKFQQAAEAFSMAASSYLELGDETQAAEMRNNQAVALLKAKDPHGALAAVRGTDQIFLAGGQELNAAMALANQATAYEDAGEADKALQLFIEGAKLFKVLGEQEMYLQTMQSVSRIKFKQRNIPGALVSMQEGLEELERPNLRQKLLRNLLKFPQNYLER